MRLKLPTFSRKSRAASSRLPGRLIDPSNVDSVVQPSDTDWQKPAPSESEDKLVEYVEKSFKMASEGRIELEREWLKAYAYRMGVQWFAWRPNLNRFQTLIDPDDEYRNYVTVNYIRPLITKLKVRATMTRPDAGVKPLTDGPQDVAAAAEARDLIAHYDLKFARQYQTLQWVDAALVLSSAFLKIAWDPKATAHTAYLPRTEDEMAMGGGRPLIVKDAEIGDIVETVVPAFEVYPDPYARSWAGCPWLIHAKYYPLTYFQEQFNEPEPGYPKGRGWAVKGERPGVSSEGGWWEWRLDQITGNNRSARQGKAPEACLLEMWERPTPKYPNGRLIRVANGKLLTSPSNVDWPCEKRDSFPFVDLGFQEAFGTLWAMNAVDGLLDPQRQINKCYSRVQDRIDTDNVAVVCKKGVEIAADDFTSDRLYRKVYWDGDVPPRMDPTPAPAVDMYLALIAAYKREMEDFVGMHDPSNGDVPPGVTAGTAIELLQQSDHTQLAEFVANIENAQKRRAEWEIAYAAEKFNEPRLIAISQNGPEKATGNARAFRSLRNGGQYRVEVVEGSAMPKTPAARRQEWMDLLKILAQSPSLVPLVKIVWDYIGLERSDIMVDRIDQAISEMIAFQKASQPDPQAIAQQQAQAQAEQLQIKQQLAETLAAIDLYSKSVLQQMKTQSDIQVAQIKSSAEERARDHQTDAVIHEQSHQAATSVLVAEHAASLPKAATISLSSPLDPAARASAEEQAGLKSDPKWEPPTPGAGAAKKPGGKP